MPSIVGPVNINEASGVVNFGDTFYVSPKSTGKTYAGSGGFNTGNFVNTNNGLSSTNTGDPDAADSNVSANA
ncbi:spore germination protein [Bacillus marinisedimentorum]|uniref:spore germination protein n=1 Tax=Bacillus marinisedimentorum TaxID=1821260 RepID=UPI0008728A95|nr:spore germination protein [Bacillus marinisedimentorum]